MRGMERRPAGWVMESMPVAFVESRAGRFGSVKYVPPLTPTIDSSAVHTITGE